MPTPARTMPTPARTTPTPLPPTRPPSRAQTRTRRTRAWTPAERRASRGPSQLGRGHHGARLVAPDHLDGKQLPHGPSWVLFGPEAPHADPHLNPLAPPQRPLHATRRPAASERQRATGHEKLLILTVACIAVLRVHLAVLVEDRGGQAQWTLLGAEQDMGSIVYPL